MKTLIVYASQYGTTEKCARMLAQSLAGGADLLALKGGDSPDFSAYDAVVVGSSIRAGAVLKPARQFVQAHEAVLLKKRLGLYLCSGMSDEAPAQFERNFPAALLEHTTAKAAFGGEFLQEKMGFFAKKVVQVVAGKSGKPLPQINGEAIRAFAAQMDATVE